MKEKSLIIILVFLLLTTSVSAAVMSVQVEAKTANPGSRVIIPVRVSGASNLGALDLMVLYNSSVLNYIKTEKGSISPNAIIEANQFRAGLVLISIVDSGGVSGDGTLCQLSFDVTGANGSSSPIALAVQGVYNTDIRDVVTNVTSDTIIISGTRNFIPFPMLAVIGALLVTGYIVIRRRRKEGLK